MESRSFFVFFSFLRCCYHKSKTRLDWRFVQKPNDLVLSSCFGFLHPEPPIRKNHPTTHTHPTFLGFRKKSLRFINPIWWWMWNYFNSPSDGSHGRLPGKPGIQATGRPDFRGKTGWTPTRVPSLKLTASKRPWTWMVGRRTFLFGARPILRGELLVSGRVTFKMLFSSNIFSPPEHVKNARNVPQAGL